MKSISKRPQGKGDRMGSWRYRLVVLLGMICTLPSCYMEEEAFTEVSGEAGIGFLYNFGDYTYENILESSGSGVTVFDYNSDGYMDL